MTTTRLENRSLVRRRQRIGPFYLATCAPVIVAMAAMAVVRCWLWT